MNFVSFFHWILILEDLGCDVSTIMRIDNVGEDFYIGSQQGTTFLSSFPDVAVQFRRCSV